VHNDDVTSHRSWRELVAHRHPPVVQRHPDPIVDLWRSAVPARPPRPVAALVMFWVISWVALIASSCSPATAPAANEVALGAPGDVVAANTTIVRVIDGDTVAVSLEDADGNDEHVRLIGIDTPETTKPGTPVECFGKEASARLHELLPDATPVRIERDAEERDRYGRLLAYVHRASDGLFVNEAMVADGYAAALTISPNVAHAPELGAAATEARRQHKGLWAVCPGPHSAPPGGP
jgi:micrococcal nuclease